MPQIPKKREHRIAINVVDLGQVDSGTRIMLFGNNIAWGSPIRVDPDRVDETAVELTAPTLVAAATVDVLQSERRRYGEQPARVYLFKRGVWVKVPKGVLLTLTLLHDKKTILNPEVFGAKEVTSAVPIGPKPISF